MAAFFVTGAGTGIGKTYVTAALARAVRARARPVVVLKPVLSGFDPVSDPAYDAAILARAAGLDADDPAAIGRVAPWRFAAPVSPDMAAAREGRTIPFEDLVAFCRRSIDATPRHGVALIEGVGGAMVPLDDRHTVLDWIAALRIPTILVGGTYLGAISHVLTARAALEAADTIPPAAIALSESLDNPVPPEETRDTVARHAGPVPVHLLRRHRELDIDRLAAFLLED